MKIFHFNTRFTQTLPVRPPIALGLWVNQIWLSKPPAFRAGFMAICENEKQDQAVKKILQEPMSDKLLEDNLHLLVGMRTRVGYPAAVEEVLENASIIPSSRCHLSYCFMNSGLSHMVIQDLIGEVVFIESSRSKESVMEWDMNYNLKTFVPSRAIDMLFKTAIPVFLNRLKKAAEEFDE